jgi:Domain of unknown function (DUF4159)
MDLKSIYGERASKHGGTRRIPQRRQKLVVRPAGWQSCVVKRLTLLLLLVVLGAGLLVAQRYRGYGGGEGWLSEDAPVRTAREVPTHSVDFPTWTNTPGFEKDVFTFVRVRYHRLPYRRHSGGYCFIDFPDSDLNLSYRLQQLTSMKVDPDGRVLGITDPELFNYPWIYMVEPGALLFEEAEVRTLREYLLNGGFLMADDFWGTLQWQNFEREMKRVFPERDFVELPMDHPVFHCVFDLGNSKSALQTPNFWTGENSQYTGVTWEEHDGEECREVHIRALFDDKGRIMVIACHNTDNGDGWEREQEYQFFFHEFSEKRAYPLGINIIFYAMTH